MKKTKSIHVGGQPPVKVLPDTTHNLSPRWSEIREAVDAVKVDSTGASMWVQVIYDDVETARLAVSAAHNYRRTRIARGDTGWRLKTKVRQTLKSDRQWSVWMRKVQENAPETADASA